MIYNLTKYNEAWSTKKLNDLGSFSRGKSKHRPRNDPKLFENGTYPLVQTGDIKASILHVSRNEQVYNEFGLSQSKLWPAGTLCITIAANIAETGILAYPMCFPDSIVGFTADTSKTSELFMHYVFTYIRQSIQNSVSGSIQDNINIDYLRSLDFKIPEKSYQDKIVHLLSGIDKKIEQNIQIYNELENMAKTLYDYWFVQFDFPDENGKPYRTSGGEMVWNDQLKREIPKGWNVCPISKVADLYQPKTISASELIENGEYAVYGANGIIGRYNKYNHENRTIAITCRGASCGNYLMTMPKAWITGNAMVVLPHANFSQEYLYYSLSKDRIAPFVTGSAQPQITRENISNMLVIVADEEDMINFSKIADKIRNQIEIMMNENEQLTKLRDWLLPMLMNGQATVE